MSADGTSSDVPAAAEADQDLAPVASEPRRPRRHRRAVGGTVGGSEPVVPDVPTRSPDDQDTGWGEPPADDDADERLRREVPPHW